MWEPQNGRCGMVEKTRQLRILVTVVSGGMLWQSQSLMDRLGGGFRYSWVTALDDYRTIQGRFPDRNVEVMPFPSSTGLVTARQKLLAPVFSLWRAAGLVYRLRPDAIVSLGTCLAIPLFFWGRLCGAKTVFIESITRVTQLSMTGRIVLGLRLADRFYVQWPDLAGKYRRTVYRGSVL